MICARDAIRTAKSLLGTPYSEMDCMAMIAKVITGSPGGTKSYRCQGTKWLWKSAENSGKYRQLIWRQEGLAGARAGMLAFKRYGENDVGHVGLVADDGMVIHSSSKGGRGVVMTPLSTREGWDLLGIHRYIQPEDTREERQMETYRVITQKDPLSLRETPKTGRVIARIPAGTVVQASGEGEWLSVEYGGMQGYAAARYLQRTEESSGQGMDGMRLVLTDAAGNTWIPEGGFTAEMRRTED